jgi:hypothetical protein
MKEYGSLIKRNILPTLLVVFFITGSLTRIYCGTNSKLNFLRSAWPGVEKSKDEIENRAEKDSVKKGAYLGQIAPGKTPQIFAPGIVNFGLNTRDVAISPDGIEFYFRVNILGYSKSIILYSRLTYGIWSNPEVSPLFNDTRWKNMEPCISPDGEEFFFSSNRPLNPESDKPNNVIIIWRMKKTTKGWGKPEPLIKPLDTQYGAFHASVTNEGTLYYGVDAKDGNGEIWRTRKGKDGYLLPELLPKQVNCGKSRYNPFIAPDESYLIQCVTGLNDSYGGLDLYINFRNSDDTWSEPINLGPLVNSKNHELSSFVSRDGRYLFISSERIKEQPAQTKLTRNELIRIASTNGENGNMSIYWVDAGIIQELRQKYLNDKANVKK